LIFDLLPLRNRHPVMCRCAAAESVQVTPDLTTPGHGHARRQRPLREPNGEQTGEADQILPPRADRAQDHKRSAQRASPRRAAVTLWKELGFEVPTTIPEGFAHPVHGYLGLHIMYRRL
jgi:hypothetical protein